MPEIDVLAEGLRFPEGPVALPGGDVLLVEIAAGCLTRIGSDRSRTVLAQLNGGPNGLAVTPDGQALVANNGGFTFIEERQGLRPTVQPADYSGGRLEQVDLATGGTTTLVAANGRGQALRGPNDLVVDRSGAVWFTDFGKRRLRDLDYGGVYWLSPDRQEIREVAYPVLSPNGIGLSPDEQVLYVAETEGARLWAFDITGAGEIARRPFPSPHGGRLVRQAGGTSFQRFDSLAVEASGNICVATLMSGAVTVITPDGDIVDVVPMPDPMPTNLCFGGPGLRTAYVTLSMTGRLVSVPWPRPGLALNQPRA